MSPAESYSIALGYFPQLLGFIYLLAFGSLLVQVKGLYGSQGVLPIHELAEGLHLKMGPRGFLRSSTMNKISILTHHRRSVGPIQNSK